jgi:hypothetical protein
MKFLSIISILCVSTILIETSCKKQISDDASAKQITDGASTKQITDEVSTNQGNLRKVRFVLYTDQDFSSDNDSIFFRLSIQKSRNQTLWDSMLAPMTIKDIPDFEHRLIVNKLVPGNDTSLLKVGFYYSIKNVGNSWHVEPFNVGETFKVVKFNFH